MLTNATHKLPNVFSLVFQIIFEFILSEPAVTYYIHLHVTIKKFSINF